MTPQRSRRGGETEVPVTELPNASQFATGFPGRSEFTSSNYAFMLFSVKHLMCRVPVFRELFLKLVVYFTLHLDVCKGANQLSDTSNKLAAAESIA